MRSMATDLSRRSALGLLGAGLLLPWSVRARASSKLYLNAYGDPAGYGIAAFDAAGDIRYRLPLKRRGHSFTYKADGTAAVAFTRRPGDQALVFDPRSGELKHRIPAAEDRSFCGHGAYSADGRLLFATEAIGSTGDGVLGVYAVEDGYRRVAEWPTHGLDPHEVKLMPDGRHLVVANGGILILADMPRLKLNIPDMDPSLVYLDSRDGRVVTEIRPPQELRQLSIRHLAIDRRGRVAVAMQYEGPETDPVPLVALHDGPEARTAPLRFLELPETARAGLRQYCGSAAMDRTGQRLAVTSPRGNLALVWDMDSETLIAQSQIEDVCGVAPGEAGFLLSNGRGRIYRWDQPGAGARTVEAMAGGQVQWDNHMVFLQI
jgi:hypothetical protein